MYSNADWNDRFSSFIKNRIVWQSVAEIIVYHYALVSEPYSKPK